MNIKLNSFIDINTYLFIICVLLSSLFIVESLQYQSFQSQAQITNMTAKTESTSNLFYQKGRNFFKQKMYQLATKQYQKSIEANPKHKQSYIGLQNSLFKFVRVLSKQLRCNKLFSLQEKAEKIMKINRLYNINIEWIARSCIVTYYQNLLKNKIEKIAINVLQEIDYFKLNDLQDVVKKVFNQVKIDFDYILIGQLLYKYWKLESYVITQQKILVALGDYFYQNLQLEISQKFYQTAFKNNQNSTKLYRILGNVYKLQGKLKFYQNTLAKQLLKQTIEVNQKNLQFYHLLQSVQKYQNKTDYKETIKLLTSKINKYQDWKEGILKLSEIYQKAGQYKKSIDLLTQNLNNESQKIDNKTQILQKLTSLILKNQDLKLQKVIFNQSISSGYSNKQLNLYLGWKFKHIERLQDSKRAYKRVLKILPLNAIALHNIGNLNYQMQNYQEAIEYYSKLLHDSNYPIFYIRNMTICMLKQIQQQKDKINYSVNKSNLTEIWEKIKQKLSNKNICQNDQYEIFMNFFDKSYQQSQRESSKAIEKYQNKTNYDQMFFYDIKQTRIEIQDIIEVIQSFYFNGKQKPQESIVKFQKSLIQNSNKSQQIRIQLLRKIFQAKKNLQEEKRNKQASQ